MTALLATLSALTRDLVAIDSRSFVSNLPIAERIEAELADFKVERLDYLDPGGGTKRGLVVSRTGRGAAHGASPGGIAFSGHRDTVPDTGWQEDPWSGRTDADHTLHGLGSTDMKGPVAAAILAASAL